MVTIVLNNKGEFMKKIVCILFVTILALGCGTSCAVSSNDKIDNKMNNGYSNEDIRSGWYGSKTGHQPMLYIFGAGEAGFLISQGTSGMDYYHYKVINKKVIMTDQVDNSEFMIFDIMKDGNLNNGEDIYYYVENSGASSETTDLTSME